MSRISYCKACFNIKHGVKTRRAIAHTCGKTDEEIREMQLKAVEHLVKDSCKYCGINKTGHSLHSHEACCPEMKRIADFVLDNCFVAPKTKVLKTKAVVFGVETVDEKIINIVERYKNSE